MLLVINWRNIFCFLSRSMLCAKHWMTTNNIWPRKSCNICKWVNASYKMLRIACDIYLTTCTYKTFPLKNDTVFTTKVYFLKYTWENSIMLSFKMRTLRDKLSSFWVTFFSQKSKRKQWINEQRYRKYDRENVYIWQRIRDMIRKVYLKQNICVK